jgi:hypothetical protein
MANLDGPEIQKWLHQHIPHRLGGALAGCQSISGDWKMPPIPAMSGHPYHVWCLCRAIDEGQRVTMRWLIELVGISGTDPKTGLPNRPTLRPGTVTLELLGGTSFDLKKDKAKVLSRVWKGCSQATGHPTTNTNHWPIGDQELATALLLVIDHLQSTLYAPNGLKLFEIMQAKS